MIEFSFLLFKFSLGEQEGERERFEKMYNFAEIDTQHIDPCEIQSL